MKVDGTGQTVSLDTSLDAGHDQFVEAVLAKANLAKACAALSSSLVFNGRVLKRQGSFLL